MLAERQPVVLLLFLVVEFVGSALSDYATYATLVCFGIAFGALVLEVVRSPRSDWDVAGAPGVETSARVPA